MRIVVGSDIHGSIGACRGLLEALEREGAERLLLLGDILYHGPRNDLPGDYAPKEVIEALNGIRSRILCVRGNCDTEVDQMVLAFPIMAESCLLWAGGAMIYATHGHKYNRDALPPLSGGDILLHGHTHIPACERTEGGIRIWNPGSCAIPKEGTRRGYILLTDEGALWKDLSGEVYMEDRYVL